MTAAPYSFAALCLPGLEPFVREELERLQLAVNPKQDAPDRRESGIVCFSGDASTALRANVGLGTAIRVVLEAGSFHCRSLGELARKTARLPWASWLRRDESVAVQARARRSRLYHTTGAIAERVGLGIAEALGPAAPPHPTADTTEDGERPKTRCCLR